MPQLAKLGHQDLRAAVPPLAKLSDAELTPLLEHGEAKQFGDGETLFFESQPARALYFLVKGKVRIHKRLGSGTQMDLAVLEQGAIFGEVALLAETQRTASASAQGPVVVLRVPGDVLYTDFRDGKQYSRTIFLAMSRLLAGRLEAMNRRVADMVEQQTRGGELDNFRKKMFQDWTV